jgi:hypothetical protein
MGRATSQSLTARPTPMAVGHLGGSSPLVDVYGSLWIELVLAIEPRLTVERELAHIVTTSISIKFLNCQEI